MSNNLKILGLSGSSRKNSYNKILVKNALAEAELLGAETTLIDLKDYPLPIFDEDYEKTNGLPAEVFKLKEIFKNHQALVISSPEYNSSVSALLKNTIDWLSRPSPGEEGLVSFKGKTAAIIAASPGALGGLRGLVHLRAILGNIGVLVIPDQHALGKAHEAFDAEGKLKDQAQQKRIAEISKKLVMISGKLIND